MRKHERGGGSGRRTSFQTESAPNDYNPRMTYRGVYRDGIVILQGDIELRNGASVEVNETPAKRPTAKSSSVSKKRSVSKKATRAKSPTRNPAKHPLPGFGAWKDRADITDSAAFARDLRRKVSRRAAKN